MATVAELMIRIGANSSGLRRELENARRQMRRAFGPEAMAASSSTVDMAGQLMGALAISMGAVGVASVKMAASMEQNKIAFETMLGSAQAANTFLQSLQSFAEATPFTFDGLIAGSKRMLAMGYSAEEIIPTLTNLGDAVAAVGGTSQTLDRVILAFSQMKAKGMVSAEEMGQLAEAGLPSWALLAEAIGTDIPTAMKLAENKAIDTNSAISGMLAGMSTKYGGMMEKQSQTITGLMSNIQDKVSATMRKVGEDIVVAFDLKEVTTSALATLEEFSAQTRQLGIGKAMIEMVPASVELSILAVSGALIGRMVPALYETRLAIWAVTASLGPYMIAGAAITTLLGVLAYQSTKAGAETTAMNNAIYDGAGQMNVARNSANGLTAGYIDVGNAASYALQQMNIVNGMADFKRGEDTNDLPSDYWSKRNAKPVPPPVTPFTMPEISGGSGGGGSNAIDDAAKAFEDLQKTAKATSDSIKDEWISLTGTQVDALDNWYSKELEDLNKSASANENYTNDLMRLDQIYAAKHKKIMEDQQKDSNNIWDKALSDAKSLNDQLAEVNTTGSSKLKFNLESDAIGKINDIKESARDMEQDFTSKTNEMKLQSIEAWIANGKQFTVTKDGMKIDAAELAASVIAGSADMSNTQINLAQDTAIKTKAINDKLATDIVNAYSSCKDIQASIDAAYTSNSMGALQEALTAENAVRLNNYTAQQAMMDTYQQAYRQAHATTAQLMADLYSTALTGLGTAFSSILMDVNSIGSAFQTLGQTMAKVVADFVAQWIAGQILTSLFGKQDASKDKANAAASAAAWAPAAVLRSLASAGANAVPAMLGMAATAVVGTGIAKGFSTGGAVWGSGSGTSDSIPAWLSNGEYVLNANAARSLGLGTLEILNTGKLPGFATGGLVTGPSLSTIESNHNFVASSGNNISKTGNQNHDQQQPVINNNFTIQAWDGKSVDGWLKSGGGDKIAKHFRTRARGFEPVLG